MPETPKDRVAVPPLAMTVETGWAVMAGGISTATVAVLELAVPAALDARTQ